MTVSLEIRDGSPWWLSPDIWVVPGPDPEGSPGLPLIGEPAYLWARVRNTGTSTASNATVRFYWANPNVGFTRATANVVGEATVTLGSGEQQDVLCLVPWVPANLGNGHVCVLAEAFHPNDPLPAQLDFDVVGDRHVGQRNLNLVVAQMGRFSIRFEMHNPSRKARAVALTVDHADPGTLGKLKGLDEESWSKICGGKITDLTLSDVAESRRCSGVTHAPGELLKLDPWHRRVVELCGVLDGAGALVHVRQTTGGRETGGLSILVLGS